MNSLVDLCSSFSSRYHSLLHPLLPLITQLNKGSQSPVTARWNSRHCKISATQRSSGEPARHGKRQFVIYAGLRRTRPNDSHASWALSPWRLALSYTSVLLWSINHKPSARYAVKKCVQVNWLFRAVGEVSRIEARFTCFMSDTHTYSSKTGAAVFLASNLGFGSDDQRGEKHF